jgi:hypothetical protein
VCPSTSTQKWRSPSSISHTEPSWREVLPSHKDLAHQLAALENKHESQFKAVFDAVGKLMIKPDPNSWPIGFTADPDADAGR